MQQSYAYPCCPSHGFSHLLIAAQRLYAQAYSLKLSPHLVELLHISTGPNKIFRHDFARILKIRKLARRSNSGEGITICPAFAPFRMSTTSFFSCCSSFARSRSNSRCAFARDRWFCRSLSAGVTVLPNSVSCLGRQDRQALEQDIRSFTHDDIHCGTLFRQERCLGRYTVIESESE